MNPVIPVYVPTFWIDGMWKHWPLSEVKNYSIKLERQKPLVKLLDQVRASGTIVGRRDGLNFPPLRAAGLCRELAHSASLD